MARPRCLLICLIAAAALAALPTAQAGAQAKGKVVLTGGVIYHSANVPAGQTVRFEVSCPKGHAATAGAVSSSHPTLLTLLSAPVGAGRGWAFGFRNTDTVAHVVTVVVTCTKAGPALGPMVVVKVTKIKLTPAQIQAIISSCPKDSTAVGDTIGGPKSGKSARTVANAQGARVVSVKLGKRSVKTKLANPGPSELTVKVGAVCLPKRIKVHGDPRLLQVSRFKYNLSVQNGGSVVSGGCPGQFPLFGGFSIPSGGPLGFIGLGFRRGKLSASWAFSNSGAAARAAVQLACAPGKLKFVRGKPTVDGTIDTIVGPIYIKQ